MAAQRIKILHVIDSAGFGGGERYILDLACNASPGFSHAVVIPVPGALKQMLEEAGVPHAVVPMQKRISSEAVQRIATFAIKTGASVIHTHGYRANFHGRLAAWKTGSVHVATVHVSLFDYAQTLLPARMLYMVAERLTSAFTRAYICISSAMASDMRRLGIPGKRIHIVHNGVDCKRFFPRRPDPDLISSLGLEEDGPVIGSIGRMVPEKGQQYLLEAMTRIRRALFGARLLLFGTGPLLPWLRQRADQLGIKDACIFAGVIPDIERAYSLFDLFVLPSLREPFGLVLLEAMASRKCVVATAAGGPLDFIESGRNGILVPPADPCSIADAVIDIFNDTRKRKRLARAGYISARYRFNIQKMVRSVERIYADLLEAGTRDTWSRAGKRVSKC